MWNVYHMLHIKYSMADVHGPGLVPGTIMIPRIYDIFK